MLFILHFLTFIARLQMFFSSYTTLWLLHIFAVCELSRHCFFLYLITHCVYGRSHAFWISCRVLDVRATPKRWRKEDTTCALPASWADVGTAGVRAARSACVEVRLTASRWPPCPPPAQGPCPFQGRGESAGRPHAAAAAAPSCSWSSATGC